MRHSGFPTVAGVTLPLFLFALAAAPAAHGQGQGSWTVTMRAMQNPLPLGQCTAIEVTVADASGRAPVRPDGRQVDWQDFELSFVAPTADAFAWSDEARHRFLCARAPTAASAMVVAYYPAPHLTAAQVVPGMAAHQTIEVALQGAPPQGAAGAAPNYAGTASGAAGAAGAAAGAGQPGQAAYPNAAPPEGAAAGAAGAGQPQQAAYPNAGAPAGVAPGAAAAGQPQQAAYPNAGAPAGAAAGAAGAGQPQQAGYPSVGAPAGAVAGAAGAGQPQQAAYPNAPPSPEAIAAAAGAPAAAEPKKKGGGGFFKKLGQHLKDKASEVTSQTAENLTSSATQVVDATAQTGSNLVAGATAEVTSAAQSKVGGIGTSLVPSSLRSGTNADNLDLAVKSGQAVLPMIRFVGTTDVLDASGREVVRRLAEVLKSTPGNYEIQAHVDLLPSPLDPQKLSEHRAAAVKTALIRNGVEEGRLRAHGYGASTPKPAVQPEGGPPSSARIEIWKMQ